MPMIEIDFETFKEITRRRESEEISEGDVVRAALNLPPKSGRPALFWESEGVRFAIGSMLEHKFRDGRLATAKVTSEGLEVAGNIYGGLSPAGVAVTGHQVNGWTFWYVRDDAGRLMPATELRNR